MLGQSIRKDKHPAAIWALSNNFDPVQVDCTTAVVLKILDNKCKMSPGEKAAVLAIYDAVKWMPASLFEAEIHQTISQAREKKTSNVQQEIHQLRLKAEMDIPKPVMKNYKAFLRQGLFG